MKFETGTIVPAGVEGGRGEVSSGMVFLSTVLSWAEWEVMGLGMVDVPEAVLVQRATARTWRRLHCKSVQSGVGLVFVFFRVHVQTRLQDVPLIRRDLEDHY